MMKQSAIRLYLAQLDEEEAEITIKAHALAALRADLELRQARANHLRRAIEQISEPLAGVQVFVQEGD